MDKNKLKKLVEIQYKLHDCCGNCVHSKIKKNSDFGICSIHNYFHLKHTNSKRNLSINRYGSCPEHIANNKSQWKGF